MKKHDGADALPPSPQSSGMRPSNAASDDSRFVSSLTTSYLVALVVLAVLSIGGFAVITQAIDTEARFSSRINESGRMRASALRVVLHADDLLEADTAAERTAARQALRESLDTMETLHGSILYGNDEVDLRPLRAPALRALYFDPPMYLDEQVQTFIEEGRALADAPDDDLSAANAHYRFVKTEGTGELYQALDHAVMQFEKFSQAEIQRHRDNELGLMIAMLFVLGVEALLIFQPMVRRVIADRRQLAGEVAERQRVAGLERMQRTLAEALRDTASVLTGSLELEDVLDQILENVGRVVHNETGNIMLIENGTAVVVRVRGYDDPVRCAATLALRFPLDETPNLQQMIDARAPLIINDVKTYEGWVEAPSTEWIRSHVGIPVFSKDQAVGFINLDSSTPNAFLDVNPDWLIAFADQAAIAIQNARLYDAMRRSAEELRRRAEQQVTVAWLGQRALGGAALDDLMMEACLAATRVLNIELCNVMEWLPESSEFLLRTGVGYPPEMTGTFRIGTQGQAGYTLSTGEAVIVDDLRHETRFVVHDVFKEHGVASGVSLLIPGRVSPFGVLAMHSKQPCTFTPEDVGFLQSVANVLAAAIDRKYAEQQLEQSFEKTQELYEISRLIGLVRSPEDILRALLIARPLVNASRASFLIFDKPWTPDAMPDDIEVLAAWETDGSVPLDVNRHHSFASFGVERLLHRDRPVAIADIMSDPQVSEPMRRTLKRMGTRSLLVFPLIASGNWYGALSVHSREPAQLTDTDARHLHGLVDQAAVALNGLMLLRVEAAARRAAEKADELKLKFLAMISHELRTPLTSIKGFSTTLLATDVEWDAMAHRDFVTIISEEADKLSDLIEQLLDLSRLEAGALSINPQQVTLDRIMETAIPQLYMLVPDHKLEMEIPGDLPPVKADPHRISQVICNLVNNAVKYSPPNTQITVEGHLDGEMLRIDVGDQGQGIPAEERESVFQPFQQASNRSQRETKGAGLGLAIARALIDAHGGRIWVQNHDGPGTIISFTLPVVAERDALDEETAETEH